MNKQAMLWNKIRLRCRNVTRSGRKHRAPSLFLNFLYTTREPLIMQFYQLVVAEVLVIYFSALVQLFKT
uniref:Ovule protein n=1 Tax=Heterorhabditis bacteriophora TaxID=37862 RepID=A0A1I7WPS4_HETBA